MKNLSNNEILNVSGVGPSWWACTAVCTAIAASLPVAAMFSFPACMVVCLSGGPGAVAQKEKIRLTN